MSWVQAHSSQGHASGNIRVVEVTALLTCGRITRVIGLASDARLNPDATHSGVRLALPGRKPTCFDAQPEPT